MSSAVAKVLEQTKKMSHKEKAEVAKALLYELDSEAESTDEVEKVWLEEVKRRREEIISGKVKTLSHQELMAKLGWQ